MAQVRVRFAPSPTGYLHLGGARTALFNWLWARQKGGVFILRIEDTDQARNSLESVQAILDSMRWLGLDWDEGPQKRGPQSSYFQSERLELYRAYANQLIEKGWAYRCYCTKEELAQARAEHTQKKGAAEGFKYPGTCWGRKDQPDRPFVVRFRAPQEGSTAWQDLVKGRIEVPHETLQDAVLLRADGVPLYNLGAVVDDLTMNVTLVARGDDHMINTAPQILLYQALGHPLPQFAHLPMILAPNGEKLSKRHAAVAVLDYRDQGYLPDAMLNYLARLGWSYGDQEIFTHSELILKFSWQHVGATSSKYDPKKLMSVQSSHLRMLSDEALGRAAAPFLAAKGLDIDPADPRLALAANGIKPRAATLADAADMLDFYFREPPEMDPKERDKFLKPEVAEKLLELRSLLANQEPFDRQSLETSVKTWLEQKGLALKEVAQPARVALTGRKASPGLFEVMEALGRERTLARLKRGADMATKNK
jgi:glutamyl-tRNA synthetase